MRQQLKTALYSLSDRLCALAGARSDEGVTRPWIFAAGHHVGELGWRLR